VMGLWKQVLATRSGRHEARYVEGGAGIFLEPHGLGSVPQIIISGKGAAGVAFVATSRCLFLGEGICATECYTSWRVVYL